MTPEQQAAYVIAMAACVMAKAAAMQAANMAFFQKQRALDSNMPVDLPPHGACDFEDLIQEYGIHHNAVLSMFHGR